MTQTITLRRAAKIRNRLQGRLHELERQVESSIAQVNIHDPDVLTQLHAAVEKHRAAVALYDVVSNTAENIRLKIGQANHKAGITDILTRQAAVQGRLAVYRRISTLSVMPSDEQIQARIDAARVAQPNSYSASDTAAYSAATPEVVESARQLIHSLQSTADALQDSLESLNAQTTIELEDVELAILQSEGLI